MGGINMMSSAAVRYLFRIAEAGRAVAEAELSEGERLALAAEFFRETRLDEDEDEDWPGGSSPTISGTEVAP